MGARQARLRSDRSGRSIGRRAARPTGGRAAHTPLPLVPVAPHASTWRVGASATAALLALALPAAATPTTSAGCRPSAYRSTPPLVIAHAGSGWFGPPNTVEMLRAAVAAGADVVDADVRITADGVLVAAHDDTITAGDGRRVSIARSTYATLRGIDLGDRWRAPDGTYPLRGKGVRVPTVEEELRAFPSLRFSLEFKVTGGEAALCAVLRRERRTRDAYVSSAGDAAIDAFGPLCPEVVTTVTDALVPVMRDARRRGTTWCSPVPIGQPPYGGGRLSREAVDWEHAHGLAVYTWTLDDELSLRRAASLGVDGVYTGRADLARRAFGPRRR